MSPALSPSPRPRFAVWPAAALAALALAHLAAYALAPPAPPGTGLDASGRAYLSHAFLESIRAGVEFVSPWGPWGFLANGAWMPGIYPWWLAGRAILSAALSLAAASWAVRCWGMGWTAVAYAAALLLFADPVVCLPVLLAAAASHDRPTRVFYPLAAAAGLAATVSFTAMALTLTLALLLLFRKGARLAAALIVVSFVACWLAANQRLADLPAFAAVSLDVVRGYREMSFGFPRTPFLMALWFCGPATALALILARRRPSLAGLAAWFVVYQYLALRLALNRATWPNLLAGLVWMALPAALCLAGAPEVFGRRRTRLAAVALLSASGLCVIAANPQARADAQIAAKRLRAAPRALASLLDADAAWRGPAAGVTADVFTGDLGRLLRSRAALHARPVPQSHAATTLTLSRRNAESLESDGAERLFFRADTIDGRYPTLEDPLSWRSLLTHYRAEALRDSFLTLARRPIPARWSMVPIHEGEHRVGDPISVPDGGGLIWAEVQLRFTTSGRVAQAFWQSPRTAIDVETRGSGKLQTFRFLAAAGASGFLLSPYAPTPEAFSEIFWNAGRPSVADPVTRFRVRAGSRFFERSMRVSLYRATLQY